jgi:hypothetical protein
MIARVSVCTTRGIAEKAGGAPFAVAGYTKGMTR